MERPATEASLVNRWFGQFDYRTNQTRFLILEYILGHPTNLPSANELAEMLPGTTLQEVKQELHALVESDYITSYNAPKHTTTQFGPSTFYGLTTDGLEALDDHDFLKITPVASKVYNHLNKPESVEQFEQAPRPELEPTVEKKLTELRA